MTPLIYWGRKFPLRRTCKYRFLPCSLAFGGCLNKQNMACSASWVISSRTDCICGRRRCANTPSRIANRRRPSPCEHQPRLQNEKPFLEQSTYDKNHSWCPDSYFAMWSWATKSNSKDRGIEHISSCFKSDSSKRATRYNRSHAVVHSTTTSVLSCWSSWWHRRLLRVWTSLVSLPGRIDFTAKANACPSEKSITDGKCCQL